MTDTPDGVQDVDIYAATKEWEPKLVEFGVEDGIARITLNRPPANVFSVELLEDLAAALETLEFRDEVKLIVIAARGKYFSAGFELADQVEDRGYLMVEALRRVFELLLKLDKPSLSVVAGPALGPGSLLAGACDICIAGSGAKFAHPEIRAGVFGTVTAALLPRLVGRKKAFDLILGGQAISPDEAERVGLITRVVPAERLVADAEAVIQRFRESSSVVVRSARKAIAGGLDKPFDEALRHAEDVYLNQLLDSEDASEGLRAAREKRKPAWRNK